MTHIDDTTSVPRAIETHYNGYRFRSRLEARWAVFLDALGIAYEHEKEGYELGDGRYLPDFWLPQQRTWLEIKPASEWSLLIEALDVEGARLTEVSSAYRPFALAVQLLQAGHPVVLAFGLPDAEQAVMLLRTADQVSLGWVVMVPVPDRERFGAYGPQRRYEWALCTRSELSHAYDRAKSARFEFGEQG